MIPVFSMLLAQARNVPVEGGGAGGIIFLIIELAVVVAAIAGLWKTFEKAGKPGWAAIVPFYNLYITLRNLRQAGLVVAPVDLVSTHWPRLLDYHVP